MSEPGGTSEQLSGFKRADVAAAWAGFVAQGPFSSASVRGLIIESWQRCRALGVDPQGPCAPQVGDADTLHALLKANSALLTATAHTWEVLAPTLTATDIVFVVADAKGVILQVEGNAELADARRLLCEAVYRVLVRCFNKGFIEMATLRKECESFGIEILATDLKQK